MAAAQARAIFPADLLARYQHHRLLAIQIGPGLDSPEWPAGARLVVDWDMRTPRWEMVTLFHAEGRCHLGHLGQSADRLFCASRPDGPPQLLAPEAMVLGTIVAALLPLGPLGASLEL